MHTLVINLPIKKSNAEGAKLTLSIPSNAVGKLKVDVQLTAVSTSVSGSTEETKHIKFAMEFERDEGAKMREAEWDGVEGYQELDGQVVGDECEDEYEDDETLETVSEGSGSDACADPDLHSGSDNSEVSQDI